MEREFPKNAPRFGDGVDINPFIPPKHRSDASLEEEIRATMLKEPITGKDYTGQPGDRIFESAACCETYREQIAHLIRLLTYRELKIISQELIKCANTQEVLTEPVDGIAQTLDDWAHMVKDENNVVGNQNP